MNPPREDVLLSLGSLNKGWEHFIGSVFPNLRYMSVSSFLIPEMSELLNFIQKSLYSEMPYSFLDPLLSCRLSFKKTPSAPLTAISVPWSFWFLLTVSYAAWSVCLSNNDLLQYLFSFCFIWEVCVNFLLLWVLVFLVTHRSLNSCASPDKPRVPCPMSLSSLSAVADTLHVYSMSLEIGPYWQAITAFLLRLPSFSSFSFSFWCWDP